MSYGLGVYNSEGDLVFSSADVTWNQVDLVYVAGNSSYSKNYPSLVGREGLCVQMMIDPPPLNRKAIAHTTTISNGNVSISGGSEAAYIIILMR